MVGEFAAGLHRSIASRMKVSDLHYYGALFGGCNEVGTSHVRDSIKDARCTSANFTAGEISRRNYGAGIHRACLHIYVLYLGMAMSFDFCDVK